MSKKKLIYEVIKESFEKESYTLLSDSINNSKTKLDYICSKGHKHSITWNDWQQGKRCSTCAGNIRLTLDKIIESFEQEGYTLLTKKYINSCTKLYYVCPNNHEHSITWDNWKAGKRCSYCTGNIKLTTKQVKEAFEKEKYTLLSNEYKNNCTKLDYICSNGHHHNTDWNHWQRGRRCPTCEDIKISGPGAPNWKGGISYEPYCPIWKDKEYKQDIKLRDGNKCLNPTCNKNDSRIHIHHIDYNKKNCGPNNLITLCGSCNTKANYDRDWHQTWYQAIVKNRYGGI